MQLDQVARVDVTLQVGAVSASVKVTAKNVLGISDVYHPPPLREVVGPPPEMKLSETAIIAEFRQAGFKFRSRSDILLYQYFLTFVRR
ncbi:MAG: hypothetical protein NTZ98_12820 [Acidobacteria bacterium]|nr:hypothetical protein [Acidobacteriota bacterium]